MTVIHHVFPYDPEHLGLSLDQWWRGQLVRWPLAAVARSELVADTVVHVIANRSSRQPSQEAPIRLHVHRTIYRSARWHRWGDDWSASLARTLRRAGPEDVVVIHLEGYAAARLCLRYAHGARCVLVLHGRGTGGIDEHEAADISVVLNDDARDWLSNQGIPEARLWTMTPSIDREIFGPGPGPADELLVGYVGRLEKSKGVFELSGVLRSLTDLGVRLECIGSAAGPTNETRAAEEFRGAPVEFCGELAPDAVAARMRHWSALMLPSYTEGMPLVALEALSSGVPVVAVAGVLPRTLARRRGVSVGTRDSFADRVRAVLTTHEPTEADWIPDHRQGGEAWDAVYRALPEWSPRPRLSARPRIGRVIRLVGSQVHLRVGSRSGNEDR